MATPITSHEEGSYSTKSLFNSQLDPNPQDRKADSEVKPLVKTEQHNSGNTLPVSAPSRVQKPDDDDADEGQEDSDETEEDEEEKVPVISSSLEGMVQGEGNMPGWFGKGCRKKIPRKVGKRRRRSRVSSIEAGT